MVYVKLSNMAASFAPPNDFAPPLISGGGRGHVISISREGTTGAVLLPVLFPSLSSRLSLSCKKDLFHFAFSSPAEPIQLSPYTSLDLCTTDITCKNVAGLVTATFP